MDEAQEAMYLRLGGSDTEEEVAIQLDGGQQLGKGALGVIRRYRQLLQLLFLLLLCYCGLIQAARQFRSLQARQALFSRKIADLAK